MFVNPFGKFLLTMLAGGMTLAATLTFWISGSTLPGDSGSNVAIQETESDTEPVDDNRAKKRSFDDEVQRLNAMSAEELRELGRKKDDFMSLSQSERKRLRELCDKLKRHQDSDRLFTTMQRYHDWLTGLPADVKAELLDKPFEERIKLIREIRARQEQEEFGRVGDTQLPTEDVSKFFDWMNRFVKENEEEIRDKLLEMRSSAGRESGSRGDRRMRFSRDPQRRSWVAYYQLYRRDPDKAREILTDSDIEDLTSQLSPRAAAIVEKIDDDRERFLLLHRWMYTALQVKFGVSDEKLEDFFQTKLNAKQRFQLDNLAPGNRRAMLESMYHMYHREQNRGSFSGFGRSRGEDGRKTDGKKGPPRDPGERGPGGDDGKKSPGGSGAGFRPPGGPEGWFLPDEELFQFRSTWFWQSL